MYKFVCLKQTGSTVQLSIAEQTKLVEAEQKALSEGLVPPSPPKEVSAMYFYCAICFLVPLLLVGGMLAGQYPSPTFAFQQLHDTGWCTINMSAPLRSFTLFYFPLMCCMFYTAGAYYFCFQQVKVRKGLIGMIDNEIMYDAGAGLVKKKTQAEYDRSRRASAVVRLSLLATSMCWTPPCAFAALLVAASVGVVGGDLQSMEWMSQVRALSAIINPLFGLALFLVIESCFNLRQRYNQAFHQKLRRIRYKLCGPPKSRKFARHHDDGGYQEGEEVGTVTQILTALYNFVWQLVELLAFAPWGLLVWVPMDTFRSEVKSNKRLSYISVMYMVFIALPSVVLFVALPNFYALVDSLLLTDDITEGDPKENFSKGAAVVYLFYLAFVGFITWLHLGHKSEFTVAGSAPALAFYGTVAVAPAAALIVAFDQAWEFIEDTNKTVADAYLVKHQISMGFVYIYIVSMFAVVGGTLYISRQKTELNFISDPVSHAAINTQNLRKLISQVLENVQLTALLLTHSTFSGSIEEAFTLNGTSVFNVNQTAVGLDEIVNVTALSSVDTAGDEIADIASGTADAAVDTADAAVDTAEDTISFAEDSAEVIQDPESSEFAMNFSILKIWLFDLTYFQDLFETIGDQAYDMKLTLSVVAICIWVIIVMVPVVLDTIALTRSNWFNTIYAKIGFVQETLAGPLFLVILQTFLSTVDCAPMGDGSGKMSLELKPSQICWDGPHLMYAAAGLTGLMAFVPLACLTMSEHEDANMHFRYTPLYHRVEVIAKAIMALTCQFSNTMSPVYSFPILCSMSIWMVLATSAMKPCCIIWANRLKINAYSMQLWTGISGLIAVWWWEQKIIDLKGVPLTPLTIMFIGWTVIVIKNLRDMYDDSVMLVRPKKKDREGPVAAWSDYISEEAGYRDKIQVSKLNSMRLAKRPDDTVIRYNTHHEILIMIYILRSNASAGTKQRALQILAAATGSTSAKAHATVAALGAAGELTGIAPADDLGEEGNPKLVDYENVEENVHAISVQTRRRLLGFQGDEHDQDAEDYHFPEVVLVSPESLITLLAEEFHLTRARDIAAEDKFGEMWRVEKEKEEEEEEESAEPQQPKAKEKKTKQQKKEDKHIRKEQKFLKKAGLGGKQVESETEVPLKTAEILYLLKRAKGLISPAVVESFGAELPKQFVVNTMLSYIRHHPPDILRLTVSGAGTTTMGIDATGRPEFQDDHLLEHILELPEDRIYGGTNEDEEEALKKIRVIRRMYSSQHVHEILEGVLLLPDETLELHDGDFDAKLDGVPERPEDQTHEQRQQHQLMKRIHRLEQEKQIIDNEIRANRDAALSNVSKVYLVRVLAIYAESKTFAKRIVDEIGPPIIIEYLMHGDVNLQQAATVLMYQLSRFDPDTLDVLEHTPGGMVFVATKLTHPEGNSIVTHRIAGDLLVELAKRFELRKSMVSAGLVGPLLNLVNAYAQLLKPNGQPIGQKLKAKVDQDVLEFTPRHTEADEEGNLKKAKSKNQARVGDKVLLDTVDMDRWCPFELKGTIPHTTHVMLSILRVFQQLSDEESFRSEFVGRHKGLVWLRDHCYGIGSDDTKVIAMRLLLGLSVDPFGFYDIMEDDKMFDYYVQMIEFKDSPDNWQVEVDPILKPDVWTDLDKANQEVLREVWEKVQQGSKENDVKLETRGSDYTVDMTTMTRTDESTGRKCKVRIEPLVLHSRELVFRMRMHRVAQFLDLNHTNGTKMSAHGHLMRLVTMTKMTREEEAAHSKAHDANLLEIVRERVLEECFEICAESSFDAHEAVKVAAVSVLSNVCSKVMHLADPIFDKVFEHMHKLRKAAIASSDVVTYEEVVSAMVAMSQNHRKGKIVDRLHTSSDMFEQLWLYHHMLGKNVDQVVKSPFWDKVRKLITPEVLDIVRKSANTSLEHQKAKVKFETHKSIKAFFSEKEQRKRDARERLAGVADGDPDAGHYAVQLKPATRDKIDAAFKKSLVFARKLAAHTKLSKKERRKMKKQDKKYEALLGRQVSDKETFDAETEQVMQFLDEQLEQEMEEEKAKAGKAKSSGANFDEQDPTMNDVKFVNPLEDIGSDEDRDGANSPRSPAGAASGMASLAAVAGALDPTAGAPNEFEQAREQARQTKKQKKKGNKAKGKSKAEGKSADAEQEFGETTPRAADARSAAGGGEAAASDQGDQSSDEEDGLEFQSALPEAIEVKFEAPRLASRVEAAKDMAAKFDGVYAQGDLFKGCPHYVAMSPGKKPKERHLAVDRSGGGTDRWFLCETFPPEKDVDQLAFVITPKGQLPMGAPTVVLPSVRATRNLTKRAPQGNLAGKPARAASSRSCCLAQPCAPPSHQPLRAPARPLVALPLPRPPFSAAS